jgi:hypothetical protein
MDMVKVHIKAGCPMCGSKEAHEHTWARWNREVHGDKGEKK